MADIAAQMHDGVSIHAPARGATRRDTGKIMTMPEFQFTRPQEARPLVRSGVARTTVFQFTRPQEARLEGVSPLPPS